VRANRKSDGSENRAAKIREYLAMGHQPKDIARLLDCPLNRVLVARNYVREVAFRAGKPKPQPVTREREAYDVGGDKLLDALRERVPGGYEDARCSRPVDHNRALAWMRQNPPPHHAAPRL
jgi:hypothetical protein